MTERRAADGTSTLDRLERGGWPRRIIWSCQADRGPLLTRYFLVKARRFGIYLHHLHTSDEDRALHDHPWSFVTILLSRGYFEITPTGEQWHRRFSVLYRPAEWQHRLRLVRPTWTLVLRWKARRQWGFVTPTGWQGWREYGKLWCD